VPETCDVCVVGAGIGGASLAWTLERAGLSVVVVDARDRMPSCFKAEKLEPDQVGLLRGLGLNSILEAVAARIRFVNVARGGKAIDRVPLAQLGAPYHDMTNAIREALPPSVPCLLGRASSLRLSDDEQTVTLADGRRIAARLVVLASGTGGGLHAALGIPRQTFREWHSIAFGFSMVPCDRAHFPFDAVTYLPDSIRERIDYLTLFAMPGTMRANLFAYLPPRDPRVKALAAAPHAEIGRVMPGLEKVIGPWRAVTRVEVSPITLWRAVERGRAGLVLLGDAYQSACPATGSGLSKVFTDVTVLAELIPRWMATPGVGVDKTRDYYLDARKIACDDASLAAAFYRRRLNTDRGLRMRLHRVKLRAAMAWNGRPAGPGTA
jgi:2-polyprenyl-6-methoxyphenol hydroxylase-like FAD-dependent oxidoreductase